MSHDYEDFYDIDLDDELASDVELEGYTNGHDLETSPDDFYQDSELNDEVFEDEADEFLPALLPILAKAAPIAIQALAPLAVDAVGKLLKEDDLFEQESVDFDVESDDFFDEELFFDDEVSFEVEELAAQAAKAKNKTTAQSIAGATAVKVIANAPAKVKKATPLLVKASGRIAKALHSKPQLKPLLKTLPTIQKKAVKAVASDVRKQKPINKKSVVKAVAKAIKHTLGNKAEVKKVLKQNAIKRKKFNKLAIQQVEKFA